MNVPVLTIAGFALVAYLLGSVNLTIIFCRIRRIEGVTAVGSKNPGVTNLARVAGWPSAVFVLVLELVKAVLAIRLSFLLDIGGGASDLTATMMLPYVIGNRFPLFHRFKGGKGVAAAVGAVLAVDPRVMLLGGCVFIVAFIISKRVSVGSLSMALSYPFIAWLLGGASVLVAVTAILLGWLLVTHRENLGRLVRGTEPPLKVKGK